MKPDRSLDTQPVSTSVEATGPREPPAVATEGAPEQAPSEPARGASDLNTTPDPVDVERLILSFDRPPRPPAPLPDQRPSSDGGRFVAYGTTGRPAAPQTTDDVRRRALAELSVLVNVTPVPPESVNRDNSTVLGLRARRKSLGLWMGATVLVSVGTVAALTSRRASHQAESATPSVAASASIAVAPAEPPAGPKQIAPVTAASDDGRHEGQSSPGTQSAASRQPPPARRVVTAPRPAPSLTPAPSSTQKQLFDTW
jgi:hypothetical protein